MIILENENIIASFAVKGAELQSLKGKNEGIDYLWSGNPDYWGKFSPILFPIVGTLKNNTYYYKDQQHQLPRHGFARDQDFNVEQLSDTEAVFTLSDSDKTLKNYPFRFVLKISYKLLDSGLSCTYEVENPDRSVLLFSIGAHPAFATSFKDNLEYTDCYLKFNKDEQLTYHKIDHDLIVNNTAVIGLKDKELPLSHELFYDDALVFKSLKSDCISILNHKNAHGIHFKFRDFPFFGIWAAKDADFVCLEPWCGIADGLDHDQNLQDKEGIVSLTSNETWIRTWEVSCF